MRRSQTLKATLPVDPVLMALTVVTPRATPAGTPKVAVVPLNATTVAGTPPTLMLRPPASNPVPVMVTSAPTAAQEGAIEVIVPARDTAGRSAKAAVQARHHIARRWDI
jgi:hypothetical protein